jgi:hypothetical protein
MLQQPLDDLDRPLHAGAERPRRGQQHPPYSIALVASVVGELARLVPFSAKPASHKLALSTVLAAKTVSSATASSRRPLAARLPVAASVSDSAERRLADRPPQASTRSAARRSSASVSCPVPL